MFFEKTKVFISGASRDFGKALAVRFAEGGAELFLTVRGQQARRETINFLKDKASSPIHVFDCDLTDPVAIAAVAKEIHKLTDRMDIVINNAAKWLTGELNEVSDQDVFDTVNSGVTASLLIIKNLEELIKNSSKPDVVNIISGCGVPNVNDSSAHEAFFAMKHGQAGMSQILTTRMKKYGVRIISLYPPNFHNIGDNEDLMNSPEKSEFGTMLTSRELLDTIEFALSRPRSCMMNKIIFENTIS